MNYNECKVLCKINHSSEPLITKVPCDEFTEMAQLNFDYEFDGISKVYPYELPQEIKNIDYQIMVICGASGSGKSTLLKKFPQYYEHCYKEYDSSKAIISNFDTPDEATYKLSAVGLNSIPVWCRPRNVLSVGEGFRADIALNLESNTIFDEFTSTIDRNVAKGCCNGIQKYIRNNGLNNMIFCSCHKDYIPYLKPDIVIDLDDECIYDCRGENLDFQLASQSMNIKETKKNCGACLKVITI